MKTKPRTPKWTVGNWRMRPSYHGGDGDTPTGLIIDSDTRMILSGMPAAAMPAEEMLANGRLIEKSPDMMSVLRQILKDCDEVASGKCSQDTFYYRMQANADDIQGIYDAVMGN